MHTITYGSVMKPTSIQPAYCDLHDRPMRAAVDLDFTTRYCPSCLDITEVEPFHVLGIELESWPGPKDPTHVSVYFQKAFDVGHALGYDIAANYLGHKGDADSK